MLTELKKNPHTGKMITFEGIDGCGKSEQFSMIHDLLVAMANLNVIFTKEPPNNAIGVEIYDILKGRHPSINLEDLSELGMQKKYFLARRMQYQDVYLPALRAGVHVLSDRGLVSVAYGIKSLNELSNFMSVQKAMFDYHGVPLVAPDLNLIYDVPVDVALGRLGRKERENDKFEQKERLETARANYLAVVEKIPNCIVIDANRPVENIFEDTKVRVLGVLGL